MTRKLRSPVMLTRITTSVSEQNILQSFSYLLPLLFFTLISQIAICAKTPRPQQMIYRAFVEEKMHLWEDAISILEDEYRQSGSIDILYELTLARYGYIGYNLGIKNNSEARKHISLAEENIHKLKASRHYESSAYALQAAFHAYRISIAPWMAVFRGQKSMNLIDKAIETDPGNPAAWLEHGNAMFYAPTALGGSKEKAIISYSRAIRLFESNMKDSHRWLYLNTLIGLAKSYQKTDNLSMARITYMKALEFEPDFKWVKNKLLPELLRN